MKSSAGQFAADALDILQGGRALQESDAVTRLRGAMDKLQKPEVPSEIYQRALSEYQSLIARLEQDGSAGDDDWQQAIETMTSLSGEEA